MKRVSRVLGVKKFEREGGTTQWQFKFGGVNSDGSAYSEDELKLLGCGNLRAGIKEVRKAIRAMPESEFYGGAIRPLNQKIKDLREAVGASGEHKG